MTKRLQLSALVMIAVGSLLGFEVASKEQRVSATPAVTLPKPDPSPVVSTTPEFVIDDCCTFPGMTEADFRDAMQKPRAQADTHKERAEPQE